MSNALTLLLLAVATAVQAQRSDGQFWPCNPTKNATGACAPVIGSMQQGYYWDFTKMNALPPEWTLSNYASLKFGSNGAEFTFNKPGDSPQIWTSFMMLGCSYEIVAQIAPGTGIVSTSVLISDTFDEIDYEFSGNNFAFQNTEGVGSNNYFGKGVTGTWDRGQYFNVSKPTTTFHTYSVDWNQDHIKWGLDGQVIRTFLASSSDNSVHQFPQSPSKLQLGLWDGGDPSMDSGAVQWAGGYTDLSKAPFTFYIKSVRLVNYNPAYAYNYTDQSGSWKSIKPITDSSFLPKSSSTTSTTTKQAPTTSTTSLTPTTSSKPSATAVQSSTPATTTKAATASQSPSVSTFAAYATTLPRTWDTWDSVQSTWGHSISYYTTSSTAPLPTSTSAALPPSLLTPPAASTSSKVAAASSLTSSTASTTALLSTWDTWNPVKSTSPAAGSTTPGISTSSSSSLSSSSLLLSSSSLTIPPAITSIDAYGAVSSAAPSSSPPSSLTSSSPTSTLTVKSSITVTSKATIYITVKPLPSSPTALNPTTVSANYLVAAPPPSSTCSKPSSNQSNSTTASTPPAAAAAYASPAVSPSPSPSPSAPAVPDKAAKQAALTRLFKYMLAVMRNYLGLGKNLSGSQTAQMEKEVKAEFDRVGDTVLARRDRDGEGREDMKKRMEREREMVETHRRRARRGHRNGV